MRLRQAILILCFCSLQGGLYADGMPIDNGRFIGGPTTVLTLTREQTAALKTAGKEGQKILVLTDGQRRQLARATGVAPISLLIYNTMKGENDCTCDAEPRGLWFSEGQVEVPYAYLPPGKNPSPGGGSTVANTIAMLFFGITALFGVTLILKLRRAT
jgi:hypothetical protein